MTDAAGNVVTTDDGASRTVVVAGSGSPCVINFGTDLGGGTITVSVRDFSEGPSVIVGAFTGPGRVSLDYLRSGASLTLSLSGASNPDVVIWYETDASDSAIDNAVQTLSGSLPNSTRDAIYNRILAGNHDAAGSGGKLLQDVSAKTGLIGTGSATVSVPVTASGTIDGPLVIGDDYLAANGRAFEWTISAVAGATVSGSTCKLGFSRGSKGSFAVDGEVTDNGDGTWKLAFDVTNEDSAVLEPGNFDWSVELTVQLTGDATSKITSVMNSDECGRVAWMEKQT
ncbi:MAG: hypothetical protein AAGJ40_02810 [Planctomycetota bacterium]